MRLRFLPAPRPRTTHAAHARRWIRGDRLTRVGACARALSFSFFLPPRRLADMKMHLASTDYGNFLQNEPSPISTTTLAEKCTVSSAQHGSSLTPKHNTAGPAAPQKNIALPPPAPSPFCRLL